MKKLIVALGASAALLVACHPHHHHPGNAPPVADAGSAKSVAKGARVTLDGSASTDPDGNELSYAWTLVSRPDGSAAALSGATTAHPTFTADRAGDYVAALVVNDGKDDSDPASVTITAVDGAPVADAGSSRSVAKGARVTLDGSASADAEGDPLTYAWSFVSRPVGSAAALSDPTAVQPTFTADKAGSYVIQLVVDDGTADGAPATVTITALDAAPVADAGPAQSVATGALVTLDGSASADANGDPLAYAWSFVSLPGGSAVALSDRTAVHPTFTPDVAGAYVVQLVVDDGTLDSAPVTVTVTADDAPVADAGAAQTVNEGALVTLDGSGSSDLSGDPLTYAWSFSSRPVGSTAALDTTDPVHPTFTADKAGAYVVQLVVNDGTLDSAPGTVTITANLVYVSTQLIVNGSFEDGLSSWAWSVSNEPGSSGTCSYNLDTAPGVETLTGQTGFPATDGSNVVLGSISSTSNTYSRANCTMYQDVAVPAGTTALKLSFDIGGKAGVDGCIYTGFFAGLYSTATVPNLGSPSLDGGLSDFCIGSPSTGLATMTRTFNPGSLGGTTVRVGLVNAANFAGHEVVVLDNVKLTATYPQ